MSNLAHDHYERGEYSKARRIQERLVDLARTTLGEENLRPGSVVELHWRPEDIVFLADSEVARAPSSP